MTNAKLLSTEERALDVWGRVTVEGADVTRYEGINSIEDGPILIEFDLNQNVGENVNENTSEKMKKKKN